MRLDYPQTLWLCAPTWTCTLGLISRMRDQHLMVMRGNTEPSGITPHAASNAAPSVCHAMPWSDDQAGIPQQLRRPCDAPANACHTLQRSASVFSRRHHQTALAPGGGSWQGGAVRGADTRGALVLHPAWDAALEADPLSGIHCLGPPRISSYVYMQHLPMAAPPHAHVGSPCLRAPGKPWLLVPKLVDGAFLQARQRICQASRAPGKVDQHLGCQPTGLTAQSPGGSGTGGKEGLGEATAMVVEGKGPKVLGVVVGERATGTAA
eukprot:CAMPEP_0181208904 /NCGR_PEP_ID=MMETSP1096-20121128/22373_1 /TAXON_ID=156174 ORGANISM="Chrysochromulina ericina, Strain CCMP281" /NCGR_SAMPLE_ID=MMETSP1096 /ASSEMBLY_ACC=CAM_ASM_000453 /LENGTH=264 /DNA_ID=CAMNT_0023300013 /DNA_START=67 /DNA_END=863 /DNA_ORIENTATION=+